jgi:hypothetical protein
MSHLRQSHRDFLMNKKWQKYIAKCNNEYMEKYMERLQVLEKYKKQNDLFLHNYNKQSFFYPVLTPSFYSLIH